MYQGMSSTETNLKTITQVIPENVTKTKKYYDVI